MNDTGDGLSYTDEQMPLSASQELVARAVYENSHKLANLLQRNGTVRRKRSLIAIFVLEICKLLVC